jgi:hypothetical protein
VRAPRRERRAARRRLTKTKTYTLRVNGEALEALARCLLIRPDGTVVTMTLGTVDDSEELMPVMEVRDRVAGSLWVRIAYKLLGL